MSEPFIGEIRIFAGSYIPDGWLLCDGRVASIAQYQALAAVIGAIYGSTGSGATFKLPDLRGLAPVNMGSGTGLQPRVIGSSGGVASITITQTQIPPHNHTANATNAAGKSADPTGRIWANFVGASLYTTTNNSPVVMAANVLGGTGGGLAHSNMQPYLGFYFGIAYDGIFPVKS